MSQQPNRAIRDYSGNNLFGRPGLRGGVALSYAETMRVIAELWNRQHKDVPLVPNQKGERAVYPSIVYQLEDRRPVPNEPKPRHRNGYVSHPGVLVFAQNFTNTVSFNAKTITDPEFAEEIIDSFENFMDVAIPLLKSSGVQEIFYDRRFGEFTETRRDEDINVHAVVYRFTTEKIRFIERPLLDEIFVDIRTIVDNTLNAAATPNTSNDHITVQITDQLSFATPNS